MTLLPAWTPILWYPEGVDAEEILREKALREARWQADPRAMCEDLGGHLFVWGNVPGKAGSYWAWDRCIRCGIERTMQLGWRDPKPLPANKTGLEAMRDLWGTVICDPSIPEGEIGFVAGKNPENVVRLVNVHGGCKMPEDLWVVVQDGPRKKASFTVQSVEFCQQPNDGLGPMPYILLTEGVGRAEADRICAEFNRKRVDPRAMVAPDQLAPKTEG